MTSNARGGDLAIEAGMIGLFGALLVGIGRFCLHLSPSGHYEDTAYGLLAGIEPARLNLGYALSVFAAPLYLAGYWHLKSMLAPASRLAGWTFFLVGAHAFVLGAVWDGQRPFLALTVQAIAADEATPALLQAFAARNEILVNVLRGARPATRWHRSRAKLIDSCVRVRTQDGHSRNAARRRQRASGLTRSRGTQILRALAPASSPPV